MQIHIANLPVEGITLEVDEPTKRFPVLVALAAQGEARFLDNICGRLQVKRMHDMVVVTGEITAQACLTCSRCLEIFEASFSEPFTLHFTQGKPVYTEDSDEIALSAEDMGLIFYESDMIDLRDAIQEQVVLLLPGHPICDADCMGLCRGCGENLNKHPCRCLKDEAIDPRFAVLKKLKITPKDSQ